MPLSLLPLLPEQTELLAVLVEAARSVPRTERHPFLFIEFVGGTKLFHNGLATTGQQNYAAYLGDLKELASRSLIRLEATSQGTYSVDVTAAGFHEYERLKVGSGQPVARAESEMRNYIDGELFARRHPAATAKWKQAESALWSSDSQPQLTTIGHLCREAMQLFATEILGDIGDAGAGSDQQKTVSRIRSAITARLSSGAVRQFGEAALSYWGALNDLVQRQEHGATKEGQELAWEDGRRVVFQTLVVMYEIDRALSGQGS